jgi:hypothetical protein
MLLSRDEGEEEEEEESPLSERCGTRLLLLPLGTPSVESLLLGDEGGERG